MPPTTLDGMPAHKGFRFADALRHHDLSVIAEIKRKSPSIGAIREDMDPAHIAEIYADNGATCLSVLTDRPRFGTSEKDLIDAKLASGLPVMQKDFLTTAQDIQNASDIGADAALVIVADTDRRDYMEMSSLAADLGIDIVTEIRTLEELDTAICLGAYIIAVNQRNDPKSEHLSVDYNKAVSMASATKDAKGDIISIAASGIGLDNGMTTVADINDSGYDAVLIGEALLVADDIAAKLSEIIKETHRLPIKQRT